MLQPRPFPVSVVVVQELAILFESDCHTPACMNFEALERPPSHVLPCSTLRPCKLAAFGVKPYLRNTRVHEFFTPAVGGALRNTLAAVHWPEIALHVGLPQQDTRLTQ